MAAESFLALTAISTVATVVSSVQSAQAARMAAEAESDAALFNARVAIDDATAEENRQRRLAKRELARRRGTAAKAGVTFEGTPLDFQIFAAEEFEIDALNARRQGVVESDLLRARSRSVLAGGRAQSRSLLVGGAARAAGTAASGIGTASSVFGFGAPKKSGG